MTEAKNCGCGRSLTGKCVGWHSLTNEEYARVLQEAETRAQEERHAKIQESAQQLLNG